MPKSRIHLKRRKTSKKKSFRFEFKGKVKIVKALNKGTALGIAMRKFSKMYQALDVKSMSYKPIKIDKKEIKFIL